MPDPANVLEVENLTTRFFTGDGQINAVEQVSFDVQDSEVVGIVGESGSGKSVTALSIIDLVESPGRVVEGNVWFRNGELAREFERDHPEATDGDFVDLTQIPSDRRRRLRGTAFSMVFQDPMNSFNPTVTVGEQIAEAVEVQRRSRIGKRLVADYSVGNLLIDSVIPGRSFIDESSYEESIELLEKVGVPDADRRVDEYPHQFSGGMLQRAMIAQALATEPEVLIADEPTTALDVTIQAQILNLLSEIQDETEMSIVLITHDLGVVAKMSDRINVMYAGEVIERGTARDIFEHPVHPYTQGLLGSVPDIDDPSDRLEPIEGQVPEMFDHRLDDECYFLDRCPQAMERCRDKPPEYRLDDDRGAKCYLAEEETDTARSIVTED